MLAEDIRLQRDQPAFDRSCMDGFAIVPDGDNRMFAVNGTVLAGHHWEGHLGIGEAVKIMTGAPAPEGTCVVPIERTDDGDPLVTIDDDFPINIGSNIAKRGEDGGKGDLVVAAGTRLGPTTLSLAAMAGAETLTVYKRLRIHVITTGDEVGSDSEAGICDSNGPYLLALGAALGFCVTRSHVPDVREKLAETIQASTDCDIIITTGGVSAGSHDFVPLAAADSDFSEVLHGVAVQPGKPVFLSQHDDGRFLLGLPGNPVSVIATSHLFLMPLLQHWWSGWEPTWIELPLMASAKAGKRHLFLPARIVDGGLQPVAWNGSGDLIAGAAGDGLIDIPAGETLEAGTMVRFLPYVGVPLGQRASLPSHREQ